MKKLIVVLSLVSLVPIGVLAHRRLVMGPATGLGVHDGALAACPASPNCASTTATDESHRAEPLPLDSDAAVAMAKLRRVIGQMPRTRIVDATEHYLHAEATTLLWRYVDDLEILIDEGSRTIHLRSASRTGYSDLGANRRRLDALREAYQQGS